jgi:hypothetical protein
MKESVDGMMQGYALVSHSIRVKTSKLSERMDEYRRYGFNTKYIQNWDIKKKGADYVYKNRYELYNESMKIIRSKKKGADTDFVMRWLEVPGLGIPKAAFVAQLMNGWAGCLDVHNIRKYLPDVNAKRGTPSYWQTASDSKETKLRKVKDYLAFCRMLGGSGVLWDQWCSARPLEMPELIDGEYVSSLHPQWLTA